MTGQAASPSPAPGGFSGRSLLAVFAHPDDESLACGGLLALCARRGARVSLLCLTRGELGPGAALGDDGTLASVRETELRAAAAVLGVHDVDLASHPDGMLPWVDRSALEQDVRDAIVRRRPDVVVTFGEDGLYWHPDHTAVHEATTTVIRSMGAAAPALYYAALPPGQIETLVQTVAARAPAAPRPTVFGIDDPGAFGALATPPTLIVELGDAAVTKLAALTCHRSQVAGSVFAHLSDADAVRLLAVEHLRRADIPSVADAFIERLAAAPQDMVR